MAHYVISDLHGEDDRFHALLERIGFGGEDRLYIVGDVVDRGPHGVELLREIMNTESITMLLGNREYMMLHYHEPDAEEAVIARWNRNGNAPTLEGLAKLSVVERYEILDFVRALPTHVELEVGGRRFYLVHGFPGENVHDEVWGRPTLDTPNPIDGATLIIGHTPVSYLLDRDNENGYIADLESRGEHIRICHAPGFIDVDCCCGYLKIGARRLACLRLEDMEEFYI